MNVIPITRAEHLALAPIDRLPAKVIVGADSLTFPSPSALVRIINSYAESEAITTGAANALKRVVAKLDAVKVTIEAEKPVMPPSTDDISADWRELFAEAATANPNATALMDAIKGIAVRHARTIVAGAEPDERAGVRSAALSKEQKALKAWVQENAGVAEPAPVPDCANYFAVTLRAIAGDAVKPGGAGTKRAGGGRGSSPEVVEAYVREYLAENPNGSWVHALRSGRAADKVKANYADVGDKPGFRTVFQRIQAELGVSTKRAPKASTPAVETPEPEPEPDPEPEPLAPEAAAKPKRVRSSRKAGASKASAAA
jgi:hypothetical protein